jgi:hypothetical protein
MRQASRACHGWLCKLTSDCGLLFPAFIFLFGITCRAVVIPQPSAATSSDTNFIQVKHGQP